MKLQLNEKSGAYFIELGAGLTKMGTVRAYRFELGTRHDRAKKVAQQLRELWETQGGVWSKEGIRAGLDIIRSSRIPGRRGVPPD